MNSQHNSKLNLKNFNQPTITINNEEIKSDEKSEKKNLKQNLDSNLVIFNRDELKEPSLVNKKSSWLLRLFESKLFNASLAIVYLYKSKETGILVYICNKMFQFDKAEVDFFLPQIVTLYINHQDISDSIRPYLLNRCKESAKFSLNLLWLLNSFCFESKNCHPLLKKKCQGLKLKQMILSEELFYSEKSNSNTLSVNQSCKSTVNNNIKISELNCSQLIEISNTSSNSFINLDSNPLNSQYLNLKKTHQRSYSEQTTNNVFKSIPINLHNHSSNKSLNQNLNHKIGDLSSGKAFDNFCICLNTRNAVCNELKGEKFKCTCGASRLLGEYEFVNSLINIGKSLQSLTTKELRMQRLIAELQLLNLNLPARVYSPLHENQVNHLIVRIPPQAAILLNSKDKVPFLIFIEIIKIEGNINSVSLPAKTNSLRQTRSEENLFNYHQQLNHNDSTSKPLDSLDFKEITINANDIRNRLTTNSAKTNSSTSTKLKELEFEDLEDSNAAVLNENKIKKIRENSPYGGLPNWQLVSSIVKCGDDLRQEMMAYQLLSTFKKIWQMEKIPLYIRPYKIIPVTSDAGLIEPILNTISLSQIKKNTKMSLLQYFIREFGPTTSEGFLEAQKNFVQSCAAYSVVSYLIQLKDRHNGNILLDDKGHIIHIDFGFILSTSPKNLGFENSPFKLTDEIVEVLGGLNSDMFNYYRMLLLQGIISARKHQEKLISLVEILQSNTQFPCFKYNSNTIKSFKDRFMMSMTEQQVQATLEQMVENSINSITTRLYDSFQYYTNNIL